MKLILLHEIFNEMYIYIYIFTNFYAIPFVSMGVICNVKSHIQIWWMEIDENTLSSMRWIQTVNWRKVHTKSFSYMFLCKLWELVKHGTNDNSFEYVKKNSLKHARDEENKWMGQGMYFVKGLFFY